MKLVEIPYGSQSTQSVMLPETEKEGSVSLEILEKLAALPEKDSELPAGILSEVKKIRGVKAGESVAEELPESLPASEEDEEELVDAPKKSGKKFKR